MFDLKPHLAQVCPMYSLARGSKHPSLALQEPCIGTVNPPQHPSWAVVHGLQGIQLPTASSPALNINHELSEPSI